MNINRDNYESFFIDYLDEKLTPSQYRQLHAFLLLNPDLAEALEDMEYTRLKVPTMHYPGKETLKKDILHECPDYYAIANSENSLTKADQEFIKHRNLQLKELTEIYGQVKLKPDLAIRYKRKVQLYQPHRHKINYLYIATAAAIILIFVGIGYTMKQPPVITTSYIISDATITPPEPTVSSQGINSPPPLAPINKKTVDLNHHKLNNSHPRIEKLPIIEILTQPIAKVHPCSSAQNETITLRVSSPANQPEIILTGYAGTWKPSESNFSSDNIFTSMYNAGKVIAEKIKSNL